MSKQTMAADFPSKTVPVGTLRTVCYEFDTSATNRDLALPYRVSVNGKVQEPGGALSGNKRKITLQAERGTRIALFLNSDVHPLFRQQPVYQIVVGDNDALIKIKEQKGRNSDAKAEIGAAMLRPPAVEGGRPYDGYNAALTGDIWMQISHAYSPAEAAAFLPADTPALVRQAVLAIYSGLREARLQIKVPASDAAPARLLRLSFDKAANVEENVTSYDLLKQVLPRTHPAAYAALLNAALKTGVTEVQVTSGWRPMLGSIVHRAGLGLDVVSITDAARNVNINRVGLLGGRKNENVSEQEKRLYEEYEAAKQKTKEIARTGVGDLVQAKQDVVV